MIFYSSIYRCIRRAFQFENATCMGVSVKSFLMTISDLSVFRLVSSNYEDNFLSFNCRRICQVCCHD